MFTMNHSIEDICNSLKHNELVLSVDTVSQKNPPVWYLYVKFKYGINSNSAYAIQFATNEYYNKILPTRNHQIDALNELLNMTVKTDWNKRKIKYVLGEINSWSKDPSTKVSAAIFNGKYPICASYNGFPPGVHDTVERLTDREVKYKLVQHAEANSISTCARLGIKTEGMTMAVSLFPCSSCAGMIISAGIKEVITLKPVGDILTRWEKDFQISRTLFSEAGINVIEIDETEL